MITDKEIVGKYSFKKIQERSFIIKHLMMLLGRGTNWICGIDHKYRQVYNLIEPAVPWVYVRRVENIRCSRHNGILFEQFQIIPRYCMECYKVVIRPRTIVELFKLHEVMLSKFPEWIRCKCGVEERAYVNARYGGYCYTQGLEEGQKTYEEVREQINEHISPDVPVVLKRACTEFKEMYGPSKEWDKIEKTKTTEIPREHWDFVEAWVDEKFEFVKGNPPQPDEIKWAVMEHWMDFAYASGDPTYKIMTEGEDKHVKDTTYHKERS